MRAEYWHLVRAASWPLLGLYILIFNPSLGQSVALVIFLSLYANFAGDISAWQAARADRHAQEDS
jgi:hypothetical protein